MLESIRLEKFTAFEAFELEFSAGINLFVGENSELEQLEPNAIDDTFGSIIDREIEGSMEYC